LSTKKLDYYQLRQ